MMKDCSVDRYAKTGWSSLLACRQVSHKNLFYAAKILKITGSQRLQVCVCDKNKPEYKNSAQYKIGKNIQTDPI